MMVAKDSSSSATQSIGSIGGGLFSYTSHFCVVPEALYREEDQDLWLNFMEEHIDPKQEIAVLHIDDEHCYVLHEKTGEEEHCVSWLMEQSRLLTEATKVVVAVFDEAIGVVAYKEGRMQLANVYAYKSAEDMLYYLLSISEEVLQDRQVPIYINDRAWASNKTLTDYLNIRPL